MKKINRFFLRTAIYAIFPALVLAVASQAYAQIDNNSGGLQNPLKQGVSTVPQFIAGALRVLVVVALPIISLFIVWSGFLFVKARGNATELATARRNFVYVIIGAVLILGAWLIANLLAGTITQIVGNG